MNPKHTYILLLLLLCIGCSKNQPNTEADNDSISTSSEESIDWTPEEFRTQHHDEWLVVKQCIDVQQANGGEIDFSKIDKLVREYCRTQKISLPKDKYQQIKKIEEVCKSKFDISGYDNSNMGLHISDGTSRIYELYVNLLLAKEARKVQGNGINLDEEEKMFKKVITAFSHCCDSIGYCSAGSGGWVCMSNIQWLEENQKCSMYEAVLHPVLPKKHPFQLTPRHFEDECRLRYTNYEPDSEQTTPVETVKMLLDNYAKAMREWLEYRGKVENGITDQTLKSEYSHITRSFARLQYVSLKNKFLDMGMMSNDMYNVCLNDNCTDEEMLGYNFEKAYDEYMKQFK